MKAFFRAFSRNADGSWTCIEPATYEGLQGRIQVNPGSIFRHGERFMNVDVAGLLEEQRAAAGAGTESPRGAPTRP
jgi:hypothetical protein